MDNSTSYLIQSFYATNRVLVDFNVLRL